ncbi:MAG TPA: chemotaxis protein CheB [Syntrophorhabdales bacterium]|nr:chemotaxis protein CheB [Syntrophorhabdales bacterium]
MKSDTSATKPRKPFPVVGIGASAGGMEALEAFLSVLPKKFGVAIIFLQHLSPKHKNLMPELLRRRKTDLQIDEIEDGMEIAAGRLYLCPPAKEIRIRDGVFRIASRIHQHVHLPIDEFFVSLAEDVGERAIAVILSGAGTDGARGVQAVRSAGGSVFVQDPASAEFPAMPLAAINTGRTDAVLPPQDIAREILKFRDYGVPPVSPEALGTHLDFDLLYQLIYEKTGYRFNYYKQGVVARRIKRRMSLLGISSAKDYLDALERKDSETTGLASDLMIGVTSFFRDKLAWKALHLDVTRKLVVQETTDPIRIWTPACATGEEPYSIAMMLHDELARAGKKRELQIFATDVNDRALEVAREGMYPATIAADLPSGYAKKFFIPAENGQSLTVNKEIRQHVLFAKHDLLSDPPFSRLDLVICRNLLIYLETEAQERCISLFHYALKEGGALFLGGAESPGRENSLFVALPHKKCRIYRKEGEKQSVRMPIAVPYAAERQQSRQAKQPLPKDREKSATQSIQEALLEEHAPPAVAINRHYEIIYHNGPTHRYLHQPRGVPTQNLLEFVPSGLRNRLRSAIYRAAQEEKPVLIRAGMQVEEKEKKKRVIFRVSRVLEDLFLIVFEEEGRVAPRKEATLLEAAAIEESAMRQLESELSATRDDLQSHIEQLKGLNEELHSSNEELQAANEEFETSREELQSLNEELITVNSQLQTKIEEEETTNNDLNNFLASANIPTIFLNQQFRVKRFTPAMSKLVKLIPGDVGRPIVDMSLENLGPDLIADATAVLDRLTPVKKEMHINGSWYIRSTLPYRTADNRIEGVVITYADITERKHAEEALRENERRYRELVQNANSAIIRWRRDGTITFFNEYAQSFFGYSAEEALGKNVHMLLPQKESTGADLSSLVRDMVIHPDRYVNNINENIRRDGTRVWMAWTNKAIFDNNGQVAEILAVGTDITERKRAEEALRESEQRVRVKLESILSPEGDIGNLDLADIIDVPEIQSLMDDFYKLAHIPMAILDIKGKVLVGAGWQDICTHFHRAQPESCANCIESDTLLSAGIPTGESRLYKCKNNMWDIATPIMVGGQHVGNVFSGQFFFEDEVPDHELFREQARKYGFDEEAYVAALDRVPRLSKESIKTGMTFFAKLSRILSQLSYSNIKLARTLTQTDSLMEATRRLAQFPEQNPNPVLRMTLDGTLLYANPPARDLLDAMSEDTDGSLPQSILAFAAEAAAQKQDLETELPDRRGRTFWIGAAQPSGETYVNLYATNITERKQKEELVLRLSRVYAVLSRVNETIVRTRDTQSLFSKVCRVAAEEGKFPLVWIGMVEGQRVTPAVCFGPASDYLKEIKVETEGEFSQGPTATCIREKRPVVNDDFASEPSVMPWSEAAERYGFRSSASFPIFRGGMAVGALTLYAFEPKAFDAEQIRLLNALSADLSYALDALDQEQLRLQAEQALRESEERFRNMFERHKAVMVLVEPETGKIVDVNDAAVAFYGYPHETLRTMHIQEINQLPPEEVAVRMKKAAAEQRGHFVFPHRLADGRLRWVDVYSSPFVAQGSTMLFSVIHDITERKQAEEALEKNLERLDIISSTAGQLLTSKEPQKIVEALCRRVMEHLDCQAFFNFLVDEERNCLRLNAYAGIPEEAAREIHFLDFGVAVCGCAARDACRIVAENILTTPDIRTELVKSFGIQAYACHPLLAQGQVIGTLSFGTKSRLTFAEDELSLMKTVADQVATAMERMQLLQAAEEKADELEKRVEERTAEVMQACKNLEMEIAVRATVEDQLRQAHKMEAIGTLAGGIAHDFNNILAIIIGNAELAIDDIPETVGAHRNLQQIFKAGIRGRNLVRQILTFSRKTEHERKPLALLLLIKETFELLRASLPTTIRITLDQKASDDVVLADATQLQQVLMNLCKNAADAMEGGEGRLDVSLTETTFTDQTLMPESEMKPGRYLALAISDTGRGMDDEVKKKLFEPFFTTKEKGQGTGMGLAVVYGIVKAHYGAITVSSEPGKGSTFTIYLPRYESHERSEQTQGRLTLGDNQRILFVDDEEDLVELGEYMLKRLGYQVVGTTDSADALNAFEKDPRAFDLVITDQTMPNLTGALLTKRIKAIRPDIPIILCTGHNEMISPEEARSIGIAAYLAKPLSKVELAETVRRALDENGAG